MVHVSSASVKRCEDDDDVDDVDDDDDDDDDDVVTYRCS